MESNAIIVEYIAPKTMVECELHGTQEGCLLAPDYFMCLRCMESLIDN